MAEFPALPLWTDALIGDTFHLTPAQFGAYLRLLIVEWRTPDCSLPNDDVFLGRSIGDPKNWHRLKAIVLAYFTLGADGRYRQKRLLDERDYCSRTAARASAGGAGKSLKRKNRDSAKLVLNGCLNAAPIPIPTPIPKKEESKKEATPSAQPFVLPEFIPRPAWEDFMDMRKKARKPATEKAKALLARSLEKLMVEGHDPACVLNQSTLNNWTDVYPIRSKEQGNGHAKPSRNDRFLAGAAELVAELRASGK